MSKTEMVAPLLDIRRRCGNCGYDLTGLAESGVCPECGEAYRHDELVLVGRLHKLPTWSAWLPLLTPLACVFAGYVNASKGNLYASIWLGVTACFSFFVWFFRQRPMLHQMRISPHGWGHRFGFGPVRLRTWSATDTVTVTRVAPGQVRILVRPDRITIFSWGQIVI